MIILLGGYKINLLYHQCEHFTQKLQEKLEKVELATSLSSSVACAAACKRALDVSNDLCSVRESK